MKYVGIDGGGTKTKFTLYDEEGNILKEYIAGTIHIMQEDAEQIIKVLKASINYLVESEKDVTIGIGLAGYGESYELTQKIEGLAEIAFEGYEYYLYNDAQVALSGSLNNEDGIIVIAGTGSIAMSKQNGVYKRCGGWGYQLGDEGSAYWISKKMFSIFCKQSDGILNKTKLYYTVKEDLNLKSDYDLIDYVNNSDRCGIASLAKINGKLANNGDIYALEIYKDTAKEICELIKTLAKDFKNEKTKDEREEISVKVSYVGGVFNAKDILKKYIDEQLEGSNIEFIDPMNTPEYGAFLLAKEEKENNKKILV